MYRLQVVERVFERIDGLSGLIEDVDRISSVLNVDDFLDVKWIERGCLTLV